MIHVDLEAALEANGKLPTPELDPAFRQSLERRLMALPPTEADDEESKVVPFARRARRISGATLVATLTFVGVAAAGAGIVVTTSPFAADEAPATTSAAPAGASAPTTAAAADTTAAIATTEPMVVDTTLPAGAPATVASVAATTTTEVRTPAGIALNCTLVGAAADCSWTPGPDGTDHYLVLRGQLVPSGPGNVLFPAPGATSMVVPLPVPGAKYSIVIQAMDATNHSVGHSAQFFLDCC